VFLEADTKDFDVELASFECSELPHPWRVVGNSAHTYDFTAAVLRFFVTRFVPRDYMVVEDGIMRDLPGEIYRRYEDGPKRAVSEFMETRASAYVIDRGLCDLFGLNFTWNPGSYIRRIG
jgi:cephalosporin hydroxylase